MYDLNELRTRVSWLVQHGAPVPQLVVLHATFPGGVGWDWDTLVFSTPGKPDYQMSIETMMEGTNGPQVAMTELQKLGLVPGDPNIPVQYTPPQPPAPPEPKPVDEMVGLADPGHPGLFQPGRNVSPMILYAYSLTGGTYLSQSTGRKFKTVAIGGGMFTTYDWLEVK